MAQDLIVATYTLLNASLEEAVASKYDAKLVIKQCATEDEIIEIARDADIILTAVEPITRRVIENLSRCRLIATIKLGYDNIDIAAATEHGICVSNVPDYCFDEVSDHGMALILACARKLVSVNNMVKTERPNMIQLIPVITPMFKLRGQTLGLVGFGKIARMLAVKAQAFGMRVISYDPYLTSDVPLQYGVETVDFERLITESDFISIHAALTPQNRNMFGIEQFKKMKSTAYIINTSRGDFIDEKALYDAVSNGEIAGAGLDVLQTDPGPANEDNPLLTLEKVILTGHTAHFSATAWGDVRRRPTEEVEKGLLWEWPRGFVNPQVKDKFLRKWGKA